MNQDCLEIRLLIMTDFSDKNSSIRQMKGTFRKIFSSYSTRTVVAVETAYAPK